MMGRQNNDQGHLFYEFRLDEAVPDDHLVRKIDAVLDLSWVHAELAPHYPTLGRPSIDHQLPRHRPSTISAPSAGAGPRSCLFVSAVCTENSIRVDDVIESPKLAE